MTYLWIFLLCIISPPLAFAEPGAVLCGLGGKLAWFPTAVAIAGGQTVGFLIFYVFGDALIARFSWLQKKMDQVDFAALGNSRLWIIGGSGLFGFPPAIALCLAGPLFEKRIWFFMGSLFGGRTIRFCILVAIPSAFVSIFDPGLVPEWVRSVFS